LKIKLNIETVQINTITNSECESNWMVSLDGHEASLIESHLLNINDYERQRIFTTAGKILSNCPDPESEKGFKVGLALGKVQSGKTSSFIALTGLAFDNNYRIVIVLAGTKKNLLKQTTKRVEKQLNIEYRSDRKIASLTTSNKVDEVQLSEISAILDSGNNILITALKHHQHINHLASIFSDPEMSKYPILVIDDEGDQASLNTKPKKGKKSSTYKEILSLKENINKGALISYTATPQANLLIETLDELYPEFCVLVEPGEGYTGGSTFHGENRKRYMRNIPENEIPFDENIPKSFSLALATYFIGSAIRTINGDLGYHSMLVHTSSSKKDHIAVGDKVKTLIQKWQTVLGLPTHDSARLAVENILKDGYQDISSSLETVPLFEEVLEQVCKELRHLKISIINSSPDADSQSGRLNLKNNIFIGGNMLERGVTLEGLAVTYITRRAKISQADTVEQRARWFGYKRSYLEYCRIFAPQDIRKGFADLLGDEDDLWLTLKQNEEEGVPLDLWSQVIRCSPPFRPTRPNVAQAKTINQRNWISQRLIEMNENLSTSNINSVLEFFNNEISIDADFGGTHHKIIENADLIKVYELLIKNLKTSTNDPELSAIRVILSRLINRDASIKVHLLLMNKGEVRERATTNGKIDQLSQGRNKKYKGDKSLLEKEFQVQFHIVKPHGNEVSKTLALSIHVPDELLESLGRLVKPSAK
jgi:Z1 domain